jgi:Fe-S oxidoreductase
MAVSGVEVIPLAAGRETPYLPNTLGLPAEARALGEATLAEISATGVRRVFVLAPGDIYSFTTLLDYLGLHWPEGVELRQVTDFLAGQVEAGKLTFNRTNLGDYAFYDPDHTVRIPERWAAPRRLLAEVMHTPPIELYWRQERAQPCGASGGLPFTQPALASALAQARLAEAEAQGVETLITDAPQTLYHLQRHTDRVTVRGLFELLAEQLVSSGFSAEDESRVG